MSNTRVISLDFEGRRPASLQEALQEMAAEGSRALAGGTDLLNSIKINLVAPRRLVWLLGIPDFQTIGSRDGILSIGAGARLSDVEGHPEVAARFPALAEAVNVIGGAQIRNMATLAGNLCNASPGADTPPILLVLEAQLELAAAGATGIQRRTLPLREFFTGPKRTVLRPEELLTEIRLPAPPSNSGAAFRRLGRVSLDIAKVNCAALLVREGGKIREARVAMGSVAPTPVRAPAVEAVLKGGRGGAELFREAAAQVGKDIVPIDDVRSTAAYRRQVAEVLLAETLEEAWRRSAPPGRSEGGPGGCKKEGKR